MRAGEEVVKSLPTWLASAVLLGGCASAGGTAGVFDSGSVWYKHPTIGDVKECGGGFYPLSPDSSLQLRQGSARAGVR